MGGGECCRKKRVDHEEKGMVGGMGVNVKEGVHVYAHFEILYIYVL
jgi:hypothetical protein